MIKAAFYYFWFVFMSVLRSLSAINQIIAHERLIIDKKCSSLKSEVAVLFRREPYQRFLHSS